MASRQYVSGGIFPGIVNEQGTRQYVGPNGVINEQQSTGSTPPPVASVVTRSAPVAVQVRTSQPLGMQAVLRTSATPPPIFPPVFQNPKTLSPIRHTQPLGSLNIQWIYYDCGGLNVVPLNEMYLNGGCEGSPIPFYNPVWPTLPRPATRTGTQPLGSFQPLFTTSVVAPPIVPLVWQRAGIASPPSGTQPLGSFQPLIATSVVIPPIVPPVWQRARIASPPSGTQPLGSPQSLRLAPSIMPQGRGVQAANRVRAATVSTQKLGCPSVLMSAVVTTSTRVFGIIIG